MKRAKIVDYVSDRKYFASTTAHTGLSQRATLEAILVNLATALEMKVIQRQQSARGSTFYAVDGLMFQSATNTIFALSGQLLRQQQGQNQT